jgi:hypothetical protein
MLDELVVPLGRWVYGNDELPPPLAQTVAGINMPAVAKAAKEFRNLVIKLFMAHTRFHI